MQTAIGLLPEHERPRERLLRFGAASLADRELLAMVLRNGSHRRNAIDLASDLTIAVGSLQQMATAHIDDLCGVVGMGIAKSSAVVAAFELGRRAAHTPAATFLHSTQDIAQSARPLLDGLKQERVVLLVADRSLRLQRVIVLSDGVSFGSVIATRDVLQAVLRVDGCAFALAHNHPSGSTTPSDTDLRTTHALAAAATLVGLRFLDHVIIAGEQWVSVET
jgi:DNA repair protein RadC